MGRLQFTNDILLIIILLNIGWFNNKCYVSHSRYEG